MLNELAYKTELSINLPTSLENMHTSCLLLKKDLRLILRLDKYKSFTGENIIVIWENKMVNKDSKDEAQNLSLLILKSFLQLKDT